MGSNTRDSITAKWEKTANAQKAQKEAQYENEKENLRNQQLKTGRAYAGLKNEAVVNNRMQKRADRERMANMGLTSAGGTSRTLSQRNTNNLNNRLGDIAQQKQDYTNNVNTALANLDRQYHADVSAISAQNDASRNAEQLAQQQWQAEQDLQKRQLDVSQQQWQRQFDTSQQQWQKNYDMQNRQAQNAAAQADRQYAQERRNALLKTAYDLLVKRKISKGQYERMTGIQL